MVRNIYIKKADMIERYSIYELVGKANTQKEMATFQSPKELVNYLCRGKDKYAEALRKRSKRVVMNVDIADREIAGKLETALRKHFRVKILDSSEKSN